MLLLTATPYGLVSKIGAGIDQLFVQIPDRGGGRGEDSIKSGDH